MQIVDNIIILLLIVLSFIAGRRISDSYNTSTIEELRYQLRLMAAKQNVGYVAPPTRKKAPIGQVFMDKLKENGRAVQQFSNSQQD